MDYTKGEWKREPVNNTMICILAPSWEGYDTYQYIAEVDPCGDERFTDQEVEANAHLIVAAKKMYEALEIFVRWAYDPQRGFEDVKRIAEQALAKAEGKETQ